MVRVKTTNVTQSDLTDHGAKFGINMLVQWCIRQLSRAGGNNLRCSCWSALSTIWMTVRTGCSCCSALSTIWMAARSKHQSNNQQNKLKTSSATFGCCYRLSSNLSLRWPKHSNPTNRLYSFTVLFLQTGDAATDGSAIFVFKLKTISQVGPNLLDSKSRQS